ncbi:hypothetical protein RV12_GL000369 [Enterococcus quebecensis]|nr:hypothetical protein RV12_GL000369 [Enterococcus quebecensis]
MFGILSVIILSPKTTPVLAKDKIEEKKSMNKSDKKNRKLTDSKATKQNNRTAKVLDPVENEAGLMATPKVLIMKQKEVFPNIKYETELSKLFSKKVIPHPEAGAVYEYVTVDGTPVTPSSKQIGFQTIYVKITEKKTLTSIVVPIPVTVTDLGTSLLMDNQIALQTDHTNGRIILYPNETANKTPEELQELVKTKSNVRSWNVEDGTSVSVDVIKTTISATSVGAYKAEFEVTIGTEEGEKKASIQKNVTVFGANPSTFVTIGRNVTLELGTNPTNLFTKFQTVNSSTATNAVYQFVDENGKALKEFDTGTVGFHWAYVKMTDKTSEDVAVTIKVPISVTNAETTALLANTVMVKADTNIVIYPNETKGKSKEEVMELIQSKANLSAWNMSTGETVAASFTDTTVVNDLVDKYVGTIKVELDGKSSTTKRNVILFGGNVKPPGYFTVEQYKDFDMGTEATNIFYRVRSLNDYNPGSSKYEWVKNEAGEPTEPVNTFVTNKAGLNWGYIKMTDKGRKDISTVIPIPITVTREDKVIILDSKVGLSYNSAIQTLSEGELKGKTVSQIIQLLTQKIAPEAWELTSGEKLDVRITETTINASSKGSGEVTVTTTMPDGKVKDTQVIQPIYPDDIFADEDINQWEEITYGIPKEKGVVFNPVDHSYIGFRDVGIYSDNSSLLEYPGLNTPQYFGPEGITVSSTMSQGLAYGMKDNKDFGINNTRGQGTEISTYSLNGDFKPKYGIGFQDTSTYIYTKFYRRKDGTALRGIGLLKKEAQNLYVYDLSLTRNLNFNISEKIFNISDFAMNMGILNAGQITTTQAGDKAFSLGDGAGFKKFLAYFNIRRTLIMRFKNSKGEMINGTTQWSYGAPAKNSYFFGSDISNPGLESKDLPIGAPLPQTGVYIEGYTYGSEVKSVEPGKAVQVGYEARFGEELPLMKLTANPSEFNIYEDSDFKKFDSDYVLSEIPNVGDYGTIFISYPNKEEVTVPFIANANKEFKGHVTIDRKKLPGRLNDQPGTIKKHVTDITAINETKGPMKGLPSEDLSININVYNLGAKPIPQIIEKGTAFNKKASEVIKDTVILPGHTASYEYKGEMPDTSTVGLKSVMVRMTDTNQPDKTALIKVPVQVIDKVPPTKGLYIMANNFSSVPESFQNLTQGEINKLILEKSEAIAFDVATGSSEDIMLSVKSTTLPVNPEIGSYNAVLKAVKDSETIEKTITIDIQSNQKVNVEFVDETGEALHDKITFDKAVGTTIDLTEEKKVQDALKTILDKNYQLVKKPENETKIPVTSDESTVQYQFKGRLFVQSSPNYLNFGRKTLGIPFIKVEKAKYDQPLIIWDNRKNSGSWNLTATLTKPLTSQEDPSKTLPFAIRYKVSDTETVVLSENTAQSIAERTHESKGQYNISNEWDKNESGLVLEVPSGEVLQPGGYRATILWQVEQTP